MCNKSRTVHRDDEVVSCSNRKRHSNVTQVTAVFTAMLATSTPALADSLTVVCERSLGPDYTANKVFSSGVPIFSADLGRVAFYTQRTKMEVWNLVGVFTEKSQRSQLVIDNVPTEEFDFVSEPVFSSDGKHVAYLAARQDRVETLGGALYDMPGNSWLVRDGIRTPDNHHVASFQFSPDGQHLAYIAAETPEQYRLYKDGERLSDDAVSRYQPQFNAAGNKLLFVRLATGGQSVAVMEDKDGDFEIVSDSPAYDRIYAIRFVPPGDKIAFIAVDNGKERVVVGDMVGPEYNRIERRPTFSADGNHFAYVAMHDDETMVVVVDHEELTRARSISDFTMSKNAPHVAYYATRNDRSAAERDGVPLHGPIPYRWALRPQARGISLSSNGERVAFVQAVDKKSVVVTVDGKPGRQWQGAYSLLFNDDGEHLVYWAREAKRSALILNGVEIDSVPGKQFHYFAEFVPGSDDVLAWHPHHKNKTWVVTLNGEPGPVIFDRAGPIRIDASSLIRVAGVRDGNYHLVVMAHEGRPLAPASMDSRCDTDPKRQ